MLTRPLMELCESPRCLRGEADFPRCFSSLPDADQYKYGKNRVEADAKRLQTKEDELLRRKEALRNRLAQLRKERRDLRAAIEANAGMQGARRARAETPLPAPRPRPPGPHLVSLRHSERGFGVGKLCP